MKEMPHDDAMAKLYKEEPDYVVQLLNSILQDEDQNDLLIALRQITKAVDSEHVEVQGGELAPKELLRVLSQNDDIPLCLLFAVLKSLGLRLTVQRV